jgi:transposase
MLLGVLRPIFVRPLTDVERRRVEAGLRSSDAFVLRRCQILLASARGERASTIAHHLGCHDRTVREAIHAFNAVGPTAARPGSRRPHTIRVAFEAGRAERLRTLLHRSPRTFGKPSSVWTPDLAAQVGFEQGLTAGRVRGEAIRATLRRVGVGRKRAKRRLVSPAPASAREKAHAPG